MKVSMSLILIVFFAFLNGCGSGNAFSSLETADAGQDAVHELENNNPDKAISILESALNSDPDNWQLVSILSAAYAQKHGISLIDLALNMATSATELVSENDQLSQIWPYLPPATDENLTGIATALDLLRSIPISSRTDADNFKLALLSTASVSLRLKSFDVDGDGQLSASELLALGLDDATAVLNGLLGATEALDSISSSLGDSSDQTTESITQMYTDIQNSEGDDDREKLNNYLNQ